MSAVRWALLAGACLAGCSGAQEVLPFYTDAGLTPTWMTNEEAASEAVRRVGAFELTDQSGVQVTEHTFADRVTLVHFFFATCVDICPITTRNVAVTLKAIGDDSRMQVLSYSLTPERDSVPALAEFAGHHRLTDPRWHLLTGDRAAIEHLARESFFVGLGDGANYGVDRVAHTETVLLLDGTGRVRGVYAASLPLEMARAAEDARTLLGLPPE